MPSLLEKCSLTLSGLSISISWPLQLLKSHHILFLIERNKSLTYEFMLFFVSIKRDIWCSLKRNERENKTIAIIKIDLCSKKNTCCKQLVSKLLQEAQLNDFHSLIFPSSFCLSFPFSFLFFFSFTNFYFIFISNNGMSHSFLYNNITTTNFFGYIFSNMFTYKLNSIKKKNKKIMEEAFAVKWCRKER